MVRDLLTRLFLRRNDGFVGALLLLGLTGAAAHAAGGGVILRVDDDAPVKGNGQTWDTPYRYLQDALDDAANSGGTVREIRVAGGVYQPDGSEADPGGSGDRAASFVLLDGVTLAGGYAGFGAEFPDERDTEEFESVLSGDLAKNDEPDFVNNDENSHHVVTGHDAGPTAMLDGFTVSAGNADAFEPPHDRGGGLYGERCAATITGCRFEGNAGGSPFENAGGAGVYIGAGAPVLSDCRFEGNEAVGRGGGLHLRDTESTLIDCRFIGNVAAGKQGDGGGVTVTRGAATIINGRFLDNRADFGGGGLCAATATVTVQNALVVDNHSDGGGGMAAKFGASMSIQNVTFSLNSGGGGGGGGILSLSTTRAVNCVLWGNVGFKAQLAGSITALYSTVEDGWPGAGTKVLDADPLFVDPTAGDYRLSPDSPCRDRGNNWGVSPDEVDYDGDGDTAELFPVDLDGNPRFVGGGASSSQPGCGVPVIVDMGAYEFQSGDAVEITTGDVDGDGLVGMSDLVLLLVAWGENPTECEADFNIDLRVDHEDLLKLLMCWTP